MDDLRYFSATDKIKAMILDLWKQTEEFYYKGEKESFVRCSKSLARVIRTRVDDDDMKEMTKIDESEEKDVEAVKEQKNAVEENKLKEIKRIREEYAEKRMQAFIRVLEDSSIL